MHSIPSFVQSWKIPTNDALLLIPVNDMTHILNEFFSLLSLALSFCSQMEWKYYAIYHRVSSEYTSNSFHMEIRHSLQDLSFASLMKIRYEFSFIRRKWMIHFLPSFLLLSFPFHYFLLSSNSSRHFLSSGPCLLLVSSPPHLHAKTFLTTAGTFPLFLHLPLFFSFLSPSATLLFSCLFFLLICD